MKEVACPSLDPVAQALCARHCAEWEMAQGRQKWLRGSTRPWRIHAGASPLLPSSVAPVRSPGISKSLRPVVVARSPHDLTVLLRWWPSILSLSSTCAQELQDLVCLTSPPTAASATFIPFTESQTSKCWEAPGPTPGTFSHSTLLPWRSHLVLMKKEFIGPGLHLRPVHADHARPPLQWTLNSVLVPMEMTTER